MRNASSSIILSMLVMGSTTYAGKIRCTIKPDGSDASDGSDGLVEEAYE